MPGDGGQAGAEEARQLEGGIVRRVVHPIGPNVHPQHHGDDVPGVLAEGGEAHDGEDAPDGGPVQVSPHQEDVGHAQEAVDADVHHDGAVAEHPQVVAGGPARGGQETPVARPDGPGGNVGGEEAQEDQRHAQEPQDGDEALVMARGPVEDGVRAVPKGREHGHHHHGEQAAGEAHVVEVHAVLDFVGVGGQGGQDEADGHAGGHPQGDAGVDAAQGHVAHQGGQGGGQQGHGGVLGEGLPLVLGVEPGAQDDGPDVDEVLAEEGEARHQAHLHDGEAVEGVLGDFDDADGDHGHQPRVDQGGAGAADGHVVRNQQVLHGDDVPEALQDVQGRLQAQAQEHQPGGKNQGGRKQVLIAVLHGGASFAGRGFL